MITIEKGESEFCNSCGKEEEIYNFKINYKTNKNNTVVLNFCKDCLVKLKSTLIDIEDHSEKKETF